MAQQNGLHLAKIAMVGCGSMGGGMALLFAENGYHVCLQDPSDANMDSVLESGKNAGVGDRLSKHSDYASLCKALDDTKVFVWSLPHGTVGDTVLNGLMPYLKKGDMIIDCGNEHWQNTERRQGKCVTKGIRYVGCGVSGGYQAARRGPSMCPGASDTDLDLVLPHLEKVVAKAPDGSPCVGRVGTGGAGHYCKMIHNGIEHGMMSAICEVFGIMRNGLGMDLDEIAKELDRWNADGELKNTFLIWIGADICRKEDPETGERVLNTVEDKIVQDFTGEEGTGIWSNTEAVQQHVPAPTLTTAHFLRIASGDLHQRRDVQKAFDTSFPPRTIDVEDKQKFLEDLRLAVYNACLSAYAQGLNIIDKADKSFHFNIDYSELLQVWRAGCIIRTDYINRDILTPAYTSSGLPSWASGSRNPLYSKKIASELKRSYAALKCVVSEATRTDHVVPSLSASLEYLKYQTSTDLPTSFYEAELDYFGHHMFDKKGDDPEGKPETGRQHFEWKPA